jgi:hypothetical protein
VEHLLTDRTLVLAALLFLIAIIGMLNARGERF